MTDSARFSWTVLLPVKVLARAKSRLAVLAGDRRRELALALASDTVSAVVACPEVAHVVVITSDPVAGRQLAALGASIVPDEPAVAWLDGPGGHLTRNGAVPANHALPLDGAVPPRGAASLDGGIGPAGPGLGGQDALNAALTHGALVAARLWPGTGLAALTADLPALRPGELAAALRAASGIALAATTPGSRGQDGRRGPGRGAGATFVPDAAGVGTTLYAVGPGEQFWPMFGGASRARHAAAGAAELLLDGLPGLRRDVDTPEDLRAALALGAGARTAALAAQLLADA